MYNKNSKKPFEILVVLATIYYLLNLNKCPIIISEKCILTKIIYRIGYVIVGKLKAKLPLPCSQLVLSWLNILCTINHENQ